MNPPWPEDDGLPPHWMHLPSAPSLAWRIHARSVLDRGNARIVVRPVLQCNGQRNETGGALWNSLAKERA